MRKYLILLLLVFAGLSGFSQDSVNPVQVDTQPPKRVVRRIPLKPKVDSLLLDSLTRVDSTAVSKIDRISGIRALPAPGKGFNFSSHPFFNFSKATRLSVTKKEWTGKEP